MAADRGKLGLVSARGSDVNTVAIGGETTLLGDPAVRLEKPYTIIRFPGGDVEITRTSGGDYWVHVAVASRDPGEHRGKIVDARIDFAGRYGDEANEVLQREILAGDVEHIAFLVRPGGSANG